MRWLAAIGILSVSLSLVTCVKPPLSLLKKDGTLEVVVSTLGEYPTSVSRIQLVDMTEGGLVWEVKAEGKVPQLWRFPLKPGANPALPPVMLYGKYEVRIPPEGNDFVLHAGRRYRVVVWNETGSRKESATFTL